MLGTVSANKKSQTEIAQDEYRPLVLGLPASRPNEFAEEAVRDVDVSESNPQEYAAMKSIYGPYFPYAMAYAKSLGLRPGVPYNADVHKPGRMRSSAPPVTSAVVAAGRAVPAQNTILAHPTFRSATPGIPAVVAAGPAVPAENNILAHPTFGAVQQEEIMEGIVIDPSDSENDGEEGPLSHCGCSEH